VLSPSIVADSPLMRKENTREMQLEEKGSGQVPDGAVSDLRLFVWGNN
jgi:hypothetical protein